MVHTLRRAFRSTLFALSALALFATGVGAAQGGQIPPQIKAMVAGASHRPTVRMQMAGGEFLAMTRGSRLPFVLWNAHGVFPLPNDRAQVAKWLVSSGETLGITGMVPVFSRIGEWLGDEVWVYQLYRNGLPVLDGEIEVHWWNGALLGLVNHLPAPVESIEEPAGPLDPGRKWLYWMERSEQRVDLQLAWVEISETPQAVTWTYLSRRGRLLERVAPKSPPPPEGSFQFSEYPVPVGTFPDQIDVDSKGVIWFSQPNNNLLTAFEPNTLKFRRYPTTGGSGPDGMIVDGSDRVWTGLYYSKQLGMLDIATKTFTTYLTSYSPSAPAIPLLSRNGLVYVTDHQFNRLSELDPVTGTWVASYLMPSPNVWVVGGTEDVKNKDIYFTEYNVDRLGRKTWNGPLVELQAPGSGGVAFDAYSRGKVYYSLWIAARLGVYDIASGQFSEVLFPVAGESGGPMDAAPNGDIVVGTRNAGYIMVYTPMTGQIASYKIPTNSPGLKDGLIVAPDGVIWFTESGANKIAKLVLP